MSELDEAWALALVEAERQARLAGRRDIADYLSLRNSNDLLRKAGVDWLIAEFTLLAGDANRNGASVQVSTQTGHRFRAGNSTMVGRQLTLTYGIRTLYVEAGWPRTPRDGVVRGGLACASIRHMGIRNAGDELLLVKSTNGVPAWRFAGHKHILRQDDMRRHLRILLDQHDKH